MDSNWKSNVLLANTMFKQDEFCEKNLHKS